MDTPLLSAMSQRNRFEQIDAVLFQETGKPRGGFRNVRGLLQLLLRTRKPGKSGQKRPTACMMAGITDHISSFDELFSTVLGG
ncbi:MAG TPA: hypothetical protein VFE46_04940 [Pirellulales bacterium]|jgi:hypothetical protein|nr:hypothetical protein [Pirellulales bacterium]